MIFEFPDLPDAACAIPNPRKLDPKTRAETGAETDRVWHPTYWSGRPATRIPRQRIDTAAEAKAICANCPEIIPCGEWVLEREIRTGHIESGVWSGMDEEQRATIVRKAREDVA